MFTGLVEDIGTISGISESGNYRRLLIESQLPAKELSLGDSISCDGACLTIVALAEKTFTVEASQETVARTIAGKYKTGSRLHLERALQVGGRLGGHFVAGHVDDRGQLEYSRRVGQSLELAIRFDRKFDPLVIDKGSIAINGVSLTINQTRSGWLTVNLIPHTVEETLLGEVKPGDSLNLEFDMIGKYILKSHSSHTNSTLTVDKLLESGW